MEGQYNLRNPAVKRLMREAQELREPTEIYHAQPLEDNLFEWHFTIRGPDDTEFDGGVYHGRIILPPEYPMKPPSIMLLTANGRFEVYKKICLSISGHHPESWQPSWSIRTALLAIIGFMPTHGNGAIGSLDYSTGERKKLAKKSLEYKCEQCGDVKNILRPLTEASKKASEEAKELASQINMTGENGKKENKDGEGGEGASAASPGDAAVSPPGDEAGAAAATDAATSTSGAVPPQFNAAMYAGGRFPMPMMNPFMFAQMNQGGQAQQGGSTPPMSPFWPMMMRPQDPNAAGGQARPPFAMPPMMPMWNPMMARMMTPPNTPVSTAVAAPTTSTQAAASTAQSQAQAPTSAATTNAASPSTTPKSTPASSTNTTTKSDTKPISTTPASAPTSTTSTEPKTSSSIRNTPTVSSNTRSTSTAQRSSISHMTSATTSTNSGLRQRTSSHSLSSNTVRSEATPPPEQTTSDNTSNDAAAQQMQSAELHPIVQNQSENPLVVFIMVVLGIAIIALIVRRVYMYNVWRFDTDF